MSLQPLIGRARSSAWIERRPPEPEVRGSNPRGPATAISFISTSRLRYLGDYSSEAVGLTGITHINLALLLPTFQYSWTLFGGMYMAV